MDLSQGDIATNIYGTPRENLWEHSIDDFWIRVTHHDLMVRGGIFSHVIDLLLTL